MTSLKKLRDNLTSIAKLHEEQFKQNKENINFVLKGDNKYYYANQCRIFTKLVTEKGFGNYISAEKIKIQGISFNKYSINVGYSQYHQDLKRFNSKEEMLGFVIGYNEAQLQFDK